MNERTVKLSDEDFAAWSERGRDAARFRVGVRRAARAFIDAHPDLRSVKLPRYVRSLADAQVESFVESYHIDSQEGLNLFCETLRRHGLVERSER
jgi:hypothetical protein